jgi:hypothetical protein
VSIARSDPKPEPDPAEVNRPEVLAELTTAFERYEQALRANEVEVLDELFWTGSAVVRFGAQESLYGPEAIAAFRASRPAQDLERSLLRTTITTFGDLAATTAVEFQRTGSGRRGRQLQTWIRTAEGWKIVAAHVSMEAGPLDA